MRPNKTERERECEKSSESETVRQRDSEIGSKYGLVKIW